MNVPRFAEALELLARAEVEFVVVGMAAAVLQGAPMLTNDIDIVHRRTDDNVDRLIAMLAGIDARYRTDDRRLRPKASVLRGAGHNLFSTQVGDLDCLGTIDDGLGYDELAPDSVSIDLGDGIHCHALRLDRVIEIKR